MAQTSVTPAVARWLVAFFLAGIAMVPFIEACRRPTRRAWTILAAIWSHFAELPPEIRSHLSGEATPGATLWRRVVSANRDGAFASEQFRACSGGRVAARPNAQAARTTRDGGMAWQRQRTRLHRARRVALLPSGRRVHHRPAFPGSGCSSNGALPPRPNGQRRRSRIRARRWCDSSAICRREGSH